MTTGEKIAKCRKEKNLTQSELAEMLSVTRQAVSRWEGDLAFPETDNLVKMCKIFGVSCDWLLNYNEQPQAPSEEQTAGKFIIDLQNLHFEYKSKLHIGKLPLLHINIGLGRTAKGIFAVGLMSVGVFSVGLLSLGVISLGLICLGILSLGSISAGIISAGGVAIGIMAFGGLAVGALAMGGCAVGLFAVGGYASGYYVAIGDVAVGIVALGDSKADGSVLSVLVTEYAAMKSLVYSKLEEIPKFWSMFVSISKSAMNAFAT